MNTNADLPSKQNTPAQPDGVACDAVPVEWIDTAHRAWVVQLETQSISLCSGDDVMHFDQKSWERDVYITPHDDGYIIRFETFDHGLVFSVSAEQAEPLLSHVGGPVARKRETVPEEAEANVDVPLLWPKVSPLAIWALISSAFVFVPVLGAIPGVVTIVLLVLHRGKVRHSRAWSHSRGVCLAATCFLLTGAIASALSTWGYYRGRERGGTMLGNASKVPLPDTPAPLGHRHHTITQAEYVLTASKDVGGMLSRDIVAGKHVLAPRAHAYPRLQRVKACHPALDARVENVCHTIIPAGNHYHTSNLYSALAAGGSLFDRDFNWGLIAGGMVVIMLSLTCHEGAHAISAWWVGDDFARRLGRVTLNPLAHIDPIGTVVLPLILFLANTGVFFGWAKPVPVRTEVLPRPRRGHILISLAGPGANLLLASASMTLLLILGCTVALAIPDARVGGFADFSIAAGVNASGFALAPLFAAVCTILKLSLLVNVFLAFFNLIPIPPLDGSWVLEHLFPFTLGPLYRAVRPYGFLVFMGLWYAGVLYYLLYPAFLVLIPAFLILDLCTVF